MAPQILKNIIIKKVEKLTNKNTVIKIHIQN